MTEQHAHSGAEEPAPPSEETPDSHADQPRAPLGEWRGPAFWMACGALLAGLVGGVAVLVERVAVERDMMAVAATLPPPAGQAPSASAAQSLAAGQAAAAQAAAEFSPALAPAKPLALRQSGSLSARGVPARRQAARRTAPVSLHAVGAPRATVARTYAKPRVPTLRQRAALEQKYAQVFRRCPAPGMLGAVQCRRDICNGAEGRGPACKPYVRKPR